LSGKRPSLLGLFLRGAGWLSSVRALVAIWVGAVGAYGLWCGELDRALSAALLVLGASMILHLLLDFVWTLPSLREHRAALAAGKGQAVAEEEATGPSPAELHMGVGYREGVMLYISTPAVVLGLLTVFGEDALTTSVKAGSLALAGTILLALVLYGWVVSPLPRSARQLTLLAYVFNLLLALFAFGVLAISFSIAYR
jgi:hypothetical protein